MHFSAILAPPRLSSYQFPPSVSESATTLPSRSAPLSQAAQDSASMSGLRITTTSFQQTHCLIPATATPTEISTMEHAVDLYWGVSINPDTQDCHTGLTRVGLFATLK